MAQTRPTGEQLRFRSTNTGDHILDVYVEACEVGGRSLPDLLEDLFDPALGGKLRADLFDFRVRDGELQSRTGDYADPEAGWVGLTTFFNDRGAFVPGATYNRFDLVEFDQIYYLLTPNTPKSYGTAAAMIADGSTSPLIPVAQITTLRDEARAARDSALAHKDASEAASSTATTKASEAASSAAAALADKNSAATSAATATTKAGEASDSAAAAASSASDASDALVAFDSRYLGDFATDPILDSQGNPVAEGALYFNTTGSQLKIRAGGAWLVVATQSYFPNVAGDVTPTHTELNHVDGVTSPIQPQLDGKAAASHTHPISQITSLQATLDGKVATSLLDKGTGANTVAQRDASGALSATSFIGKATDADKLDGINSSQFVRSDASDTMSGSYTVTGTLTVNGSTAAHNTIHIDATGGNAHLLLRNSSSLNRGILYWENVSDEVRLQRYNAAASASEGQLRLRANDMLYNGQTVWTRGNDGSGSGLDADYLRGYYPSTGAAANSIARRDSNSDLTMRLARLTFGNQGSISSGAAVLMRVSTGDNYTRPVTPSGFVTWLNANKTNLNADKVDGLHAWQFLRSDTSDSMSGTLTVDKLHVDSAGSWDDYGFRVSGTAPSIYFNQTDGTNAFIGINSGNFYVLADTGGAGNFNSPYAFQVSTTAPGTAYVGGNKVWHAGNDGSGSGLDADKLNGSSLSSAATANTVAKRNGSADIHARLFRSNYNASSSIPSGAQVMMRTNNSDNYLRPINNGGFRKWIGENITHGWIGTYVWARVLGTSQSITWGQTIAGSSLRTTGLGIRYGTGNGNQFGSTGGEKSLSGTWRAMGTCSNAGSERYASTLWVRIS